MNIKKKFSATVEIPGSKSISNRALILGALSNRKITLENFLLSDDTIFMIEALEKLGYQVFFSENKKNITLLPTKMETFENIEIYTGNAGTVMRFIASFFLTKKSRIILRGNPRMNQRPIKDLADSLQELGAEIKYLEESGYPPLDLITSGIPMNEVVVDCDKSSQYLSSLMLSAPYFKDGLNIKIKNKIVSRPYVDMSIKMIRDFGGEIFETSENKIFKVVPGNYNLDSYLIEGDMSSASYFIAMALITDSTITIKNYFQESIQGDKLFLDIFLQLGGTILAQGETWITVKGAPNYPGIDIDLNNAPDIAQTLAVTALFADTPTTVRNVENMRIKETDRISALKNEIEKIGGKFIEYQDGFTVIPQKKYYGASIETYDDHRMAMSFALAGMRIENIVIKDPNCVSKTFPDFFSIIER
ncbi:MAG: 3-phosphoshikimate 1-carboxyvinyltransferase, partial [Fusobacteriaceae bacterium]